MGESVSKIKAERRRKMEEAAQYSGKEWMDSKAFSKQDFKQKCADALNPKPCGEKEKYTILMIGKQGAGKSSLISTLLTNAGTQNHVKRSAPVGVDDFSYTLTMKRYHLSESIDVLDMPGYNESGSLNADRDFESTLKLIADMLEGNFKSELQEDAHSKVESDPSQSVDAVVLVCDASKEQTSGNKLSVFYKKIQNLCKDRRVGFSVALTKVDHFCNDLEKIFKHKDVGDQVKALASMLGIQYVFVLPIQNYTNQRYRVDSIDRLALDFVLIMGQTIAALKEHA